jgi:hypothetical protein
MGCWMPLPTLRLQIALENHLVRLLPSGTLSMDIHQRHSTMKHGLFAHPWSCDLKFCSADILLRADDQCCDCDSLNVSMKSDGSRAAVTATACT